MVELTSRCIAFAEGVVTMVCPVLLALALKKDKWNGKEDDPVVQMLMPVIAGATLITSVCPLLACCISERFPKTCVRWPSVTRSLAAPFSSACLLGLACWISLLIVSESFVIAVGVPLGLFLVIRPFSYWLENAESPQITGEPRVASMEETKELRTIVDKSHEFLSGVTGILFLGLEGMALEGLISAYLGTEDALRPHMNISFGLCALGVTLMSVEMTPPRIATRMTGVVFFTEVAMAVGTAAILATIMKKLMGNKGLMFLGSPFLIFFQLVYRLVSNAWRAARQRQTQVGILPTSSSHQGEENQGAGDNQGEENKGAGDNQGEESTAAPLGLTKVTFTGFLVVSVKAISSGSPDEWTVCFLLFAAAAIASGVSWRLLTHTQNKSIVGEKSANEAANVASFCTHFCVAVATVLFAVMAWEAGTAKEHVISACAHVSQVTCLHHNNILDVQHVRDMCACIDQYRN